MSGPADYYDMSRIRPEVAKVLNDINALGPKMSERAVAIDLDASFPTQNYKDLADLGYLTLTVPTEFGGHGFSLGEYAMVGAEIGKYCGATALTFNMHNSSMMWSRFMYEMPHLSDDERAAFAPLRARQFRRLRPQPGWRDGPGLR